jgi:hypothetical protein
MRTHIIWLAVASLTLSACAPPGTYRKIRNGIREVAVKELGPADHYDIKTSRDKPSRLMKGRISRVEVHGVNVRPGPAYLLDEVFVSARNVKYNRKQRAVEGAESTQAQAYITESSLAFMLSETGALKEPKVTIGAHHVELSGQYAVFGALPMDVVATGTVRTTGRAGVEFVSDTVTAGGVKMPMSFAKAFDFSKVYPALLISTVSTEPGRAVLTGTLDWSKLGIGAEHDM